MSILNNIRVVLCNTSHNGNIGSAARAMKTMGISDLWLVSPQVLPDDHSRALSCNAYDVLENAKIVNSLDDALSDTTLSFATTARRREFSEQLFTPRESASEILQTITNGEKIALVFGAEKTGLSIEEVEKCNRLLTIPGNPEYFSLNLANAVQIVCYEIYSNYDSNLSKFKNNEIEKATYQDNQGIIAQLEHVLKQINYGKNINQTMRNLQHIVNKANLERNEVDLVRGILRNIEKIILNNYCSKIKQ